MLVVFSVGGLLYVCCVVYRWCTMCLLSLAFGCSREQSQFHQQCGKLPLNTYLRSVSVFMFQQYPYENISSVYTP